MAQDLRPWKERGGALPSAPVGRVHPAALSIARWIAEVDAAVLGGRAATSRTSTPTPHTADGADFAIYAAARVLVDADVGPCARVVDRRGAAAARASPSGSEPTSGGCWAAGEPVLERHGSRAEDGATMTDERLHRAERRAIGC